ncbi:MAG: 2-oxoglutarate dehydrogenase, subunit, partial [Actinotalea sp.]|nr:2-oxoglutarate dehydrogenase, subunit [Actinotalea sp.]
AWTFISQHLPEGLGRSVRRVSRPAAASPATGSHKTHAVEQAGVVEAAFAR